MKNNFFYAVGRRKTASARVKLSVGTGDVLINNIKTNDKSLIEPLSLINENKKWNVVATVKGGGVQSQLDAVKLGIARALIKYNPEFKTTFKKLDLLTRDPREKERKKPGLKRARKAPQWSKR